jgi:predicted nucleic acid-binding Zn ribbon protein
VSVATPTPAPTSAQAGVSPQELCPLCGAPLKPEQSWCLRCGAAARTRLAAQPKWKALVVALLVMVVLSLGVLAAALVKLAG